MYDLETAMNMDALYRSWQKVSAKNACLGIDGIDISLYRSDLQKNLRSLQTSVTSGNYRPYTEKVYHHKDRIICISCVDDKIIQTMLAEIIMAVYAPAKSVHGFIPKRSVFTAKKLLEDALSSGISEYSKIDIKRFYDTIDEKILLDKVALVIADVKLIALFKLLIDSHTPGISTGSCLSPALSNLYLADFDDKIEKNSVFYSRYVDDILVAPVTNTELIKEKLAEVNLDINSEKSKTVNASDGFRYLGFDIKRDIDRAIQNSDFALAEAIYEAQESDVAANEPPPKPDVQSVPAPAPETPAKTEYELPNTIRNVVKKCHIVKAIADKAETGNRLDLADKMHLLQIFYCLGEVGAKFIHHTLSKCDDYDYAETQRRISRYNVPNPIGCKKLCERTGDISKCSCSFAGENIYPTPIIHALRVDRECFKPTAPQDNIGHFKAKNPKDKAMDALSAMIELNKKRYEIAEQHKILKGQIEEKRRRDHPAGTILRIYEPRAAA